MMTLMILRPKVRGTCQGHSDSEITHGFSLITQRTLGTQVVSLGRQVGHDCYVTTVDFGLMGQRSVILGYYYKRTVSPSL